MLFRRLGAALLSFLLCAEAIPQVPTQEDLQQLKESMSGDQTSVLEGLLGGKGQGTQKNEKKLAMPETVKPRRKSDQYNEYGIKQKTRDGRNLRQLNEDPELRADDTVLIEINPKGVPFPPSPAQPQQVGVLPGAAVPGGFAGFAAGAQNAAAAPSNLNAAAAAAGLSQSLTTAGVAPQTTITPQTNSPSDEENEKNRPPGFQEKPKTDEEKAKLTEFRKRVLANNPYKLNHYGVLDIPGLPAIPLAGLTAGEATARLNGDPDFADFNVRLTLLRLEDTGAEALKPFGYDLFEGEPSTFAPVEDIQVPMDYVIGPGDTLNVMLYGGETSTYQLSVQRDGHINFPKLGPIVVGGLSFDAARDTIEQRVAQQLIGMHVNVTMGDLRSIRVFVLGDAETPGSYTVSGLSTMTNALFVSGGVKKNGSLRRIQLKRNGVLVSELDLYDLLLHGDTSSDRQLKPGDVIFIPPIGPTVGMYGAVRRPAIYELKNETNAWQAVELAGGLTPDADAQSGQLKRVLPSQRFEMENVNLTVAAGRNTEISDGDKLRIPTIKPTLENSVKLSGYVYRPGEFEYREGLRLSDVIHSFDELRPNADLHYILIRRQLPPEFKVSVTSADLARALAAPKSAADPLLHPRDEIIAFDLSVSRERLLEPILKDLELEATPDKPDQVVSIDGNVKAPGRYPLEPGMRVSDLIRAGGSLEDSAYRADAELTRYTVVDGTDRRTELIPVNLAAIRQGDAAADLPLQPYDVLVVKPIVDWVEPGTIELAGEVRHPGKYPIHQGETLHSVLLRAGGLTDYAFAEGAVFIREELKKREKEQLELLTNRLQSDLAALSLQAVASSAMTSSGAGASAANSLIVGNQLLAQLRETKPVGRLVIDLQGVIKNPLNAAGDVVVRDGDRLLVPKQFKDITILGEVQSPTSHVYQPGLSRDDYIGKSGGLTQKADRKRIYVVRANGDVVAAGARNGWFRRSATSGVEIRPGDTIVVPLNAEHVPALPLWQSVTTIIYNLAIALLAVRSASLL